MLTKRNFVVRSEAHPDKDAVEISVNLSTRKAFIISNIRLTRECKTHQEADALLKYERQRLIKDIWFETYGDLFIELQRLRTVTERHIPENHAAEVQLAFNRMINLLTPPEP